MNRFTFLLARLMILFGIIVLPFQAFSFVINPLDDVVLYDDATDGILSYRIYQNQDGGNMYAEVKGVKNKESGDYPIPSTIEYGFEIFDEVENEWRLDTIELEVKSIGHHAFSSTNIRNLELPNTILYIGEQAFSFTRLLKRVDIPNSVIYIGEGAFESSGMESVSIPASVQYIGTMAFIPNNDNSNLKCITVDENNPFYDSREDCNCIIRTADNVLISGSNNSFIPDGITKIEKYAFCNCKSIASITIPSSVTHIGEGAFSECSSIESIIIPNSVLAIEGWCFDYCSNLKNAQLGNSLEFIGHDAFSYTSIQEIVIPKTVREISGSLFKYAPYLHKIEVEAGNRFYDSRENCNAIIKTSTNYLLDGCADKIPNTVKIIGPCAFAGRQCLNEVVIPNSVDSIGYLAFSQSRATKVRIGNSVKSIGASCFRDCYDLQYVMIGEGVDFIDDYSFYNCALLTTVICLAVDPPYIWNACNNFNGKKLYVPTAVHSIYNDHPFWHSNFPIILPLDDLRGDIDYDGKISISDVTELIDKYFLAASFESAYFNESSADVDGDGFITIADVVTLIDLLLNQDQEETEEQTTNL